MTTLTKIADYFNLNLNQRSPIEIPNTDRWRSFTSLINHLQLTTGAEIGTERAIFAKRLCVTNPQLHLYCVDPWTAYKDYREHVSQSKLDDFYKEAEWRLKPFNATLVRKFSVEASQDFADESLDFVYIDGNHSLLHVVQDLWHWVPKVRKGGIISGHDYIQRINPSYAMHVVEAVNAYTQAFRVQPWFLLGRKDVVEGELRDRPRSFFWVRELVKLRR